MENVEVVQVEINGVKMEVDLRTAKRIETLRVGTRVKILRKKWGDTFEVLPGVVVGFEPFRGLPTIIVATVDLAEAKVEFVYYNAKQKDVEMVAAVDDVLLDRETVEAKFEQAIGKHRREIADIEEKRDYFRRTFGLYWRPIAETEVEQPA